jgi:hypothetical protein
MCIILAHNNLFENKFDLNFKQVPESSVINRGQNIRSSPGK